MRLVTVHLPEEFLEGLEELVRRQRYPTRSEAIRVAIRDLLKDEVWKHPPSTEDILAPVWKRWAE